MYMHMCLYLYLVPIPHDSDFMIDTDSYADPNTDHPCRLKLCDLVISKRLSDDGQQRSRCVWPW